jgi:hypothetical protein
MADPGSAGAARGTNTSLPDKETLERQKLDAEIREIEARIRAGDEAAELNRKTKVRTTVMAWVGVAGALVAAFGGLSAAFIQGGNFLAEKQRENYAAVTNQMVTLAKDLQSTNSSRVSDGAALLLSTWGGDSVSLLLYNLTWVEEPAATIQALSHMAVRNAAAHEQLLSDLVVWSRRTFVRELAHNPMPPESIKALQNFILAIGDLGDCRVTRHGWISVVLHPLDSLGRRGDGCDFRMVLAEFEATLTKTPDPPLKAFHKSNLLQLIKDAHAKLEARR